MGTTIPIVIGINNNIIKASVKSSQSSTFCCNSVKANPEPIIPFIVTHKKSRAKKDKRPNRKVRKSFNFLIFHQKIVVSPAKNIVRTVPKINIPFFKSIISLYRYLKPTVNTSGSMI